MHFGPHDIVYPDTLSRGKASRLRSTFFVTITGWIDFTTPPPTAAFCLRRGLDYLTRGPSSLNACTSFIASTTNSFSLSLDCSCAVIHSSQARNFQGPLLFFQFTMASPDEKHVSFDEPLLARIVDEDVEAPVDKKRARYLWLGFLVVVLLGMVVGGPAGKTSTPGMLDESN